MGSPRSGTKHRPGRETPPDFRVPQPWLPSSLAAGDSDTCLGRGGGSRRPVRACVQMDGPLGMRAFIPGRGGRGQGSKPQLPPCLGREQPPRAALAGCFTQFVPFQQQLGWQGCAGALGCLCVPCLLCQADAARKAQPCSWQEAHPDPQQSLESSFN